ncbi:bifunctional GNAT family N-acetyltransferase/class I SAM-dependent methyltransferase [Agarivorans aestuarii]|uniref:Bifunctional GNAT family N-acetyltransferase/class I SAM-dependent methyltransferase n=1 Tax=Agarivorans aestuarii TaxID=1563703 RepID=A0ABU7G815_9ALTE|nr:bifunctional GNAT family N-acetyltransferase/class I SAM-dependent methyltransferase [Agarivorans aestuarii]MEE1675553.1 bifunctional GNAT family N-acetyltransferase/class I SAM-dependent methyltransferase [Agarivorans aestuarii]
MNKSPLRAQLAWPEQQRAQVAKLYEQAFGQKFRLAVPDQQQRIRLLAQAFKAEYSLSVIDQGKLVAVAGFQTPKAGFTSGIGWQGLVDLLGYLKGAWAALVFSLFERKASQQTMVMDGIVVDESYRGLGLGSMLLDGIIEQARAQGFSKLRLDVIDTNPRAKKLYLAKGFKVVKTETYPYLNWLLGFSGSSTLEYILDTVPTDQEANKSMTQPSAEKAPMYSTYANEYDLAIRDNVFNAHYERPSLQAMLGDLQGKRVLDLGCGSGVYAEYLLAEGAVVTAIDGSAEMIELVNQKLAGKVRCYQQDLGAGLPEESDASYDMVICPLMLHYLEDLNPLFADVKRVLVSGGQFVFSTHHPMVDIEASSSGNYFATELITEQWDTVGKPVAVSFYRRPLSALIGALSNNGMLLAELSEGKPSEALKTISLEHYQRLSEHPQFLFIKALA